ncbi:MAG: YhcH/YjgK/YiaL family protein [Dysgonomonas sp.]
MIIDNLKNSALYEDLNPLFSKAFEYIKQLDFSNLELGKTVLVENELTVAVSDSTLKNVDDAKFEAHNRYIDIQIPVSRAEGFGWSFREDVKNPVSEFDNVKDVIFYKDKPSVHFEINPGNFVILFPKDVHAPCIGEGSIRKIVVKVLVK